MDHSRLPLRFWFFTAFMMQSKVSVRELAEALKLPYNTMFSVVKGVGGELYLTASTWASRVSWSWTRSTRRLASRVRGFQEGAED